MFKGSLFGGFCLFLGLLSVAVQAQTEALQQQLYRHIEQQLQPQLDDTVQLRIDLKPGSRNLKLQRCGNPIRFSSKRPLGSGAFTIKAECDYPRRWSRYLHGQIALTRPVLVSTRPLAKGSQLSTDDLRLAWRDQGQLHGGYFDQLQAVIGFELKRSINADRPITPSLLRPPVLIKRGDSVNIQAGRGGVSVQMTGTAIEDGRKGQQIRVRNNRSGREIRARVIDSGLVSVGP
ncbi:flagella basal body P-ring formation protein FlgA [Motiliproteus coralliicola]|uniref:Flagella basal body P-ring formation protein FlgA n=1 Tax=Motiliproteus coralliicola TaxID=2283196 RepID=A0A369WME8_9GAMM|nr:flagellar basal body P-ring formation chaperone FlgA [Motiliproteus coralliicola]RDE22383.1 flagella basal body P-ring formation protein FlgA [Motiliproteus coralliicola]